MTRITRSRIRKIMEQILARQGRSASFEEGTSLRDLGFRSLDFSELALRCETEGDRTLKFEGAELRSIQTVGDVLDFLEKALAAED